jgi:putative membrane protein
MLSEAEHVRVAEAVARAEDATSGEIVCILANEVSNYRETPLAWAAAAALIGTPLALWLGADPAWLTPWRSGWSAAHVSAVNAGLVGVLEAWALAQVVLFALVAGLVSIPPVRRVLTPPPLKTHRVHRAALQQFLATGLHLAAGRTGVVIFASRHDRRVEVLADDAIHAAVGDAVWTAAVKAVQEGMRRNDPAAGFVRAIDLCGAVLAEHFPAQGAKANALSDRLLEL